MVSAPSARLGAWLAHVRGFADEIVLSVDAASGAESVALARSLADSVSLVELDGHANPAYGPTAERATCDWILMLDDDETLAAGFRQTLPELLVQSYTHYHLPVRWIVPDGDGRLAWIRQFPWYPNHATRLFRNLRGCFRRAARVHSVWEVAGEGRALPPDEDAIYHLKLALLDRPARERKVERYRRAAGRGFPSCEEYYLYEDYEELERVPFVPNPAGAAMLEAGGPVAARARSEHSEPTVGLDQLYTDAADRSDAPPIWGATFLHDTTPARLAVNRGSVVGLRLRNSSDGTWPSRGDVAGRVVLSYRWRRVDGTLVIPQGDITLLPHALAPGEEAELVAGLWAPAEPGRYLLGWELLCERVAWFSDRGVAPCVREVEVFDRGPRPRARHFPQTLLPTGADSRRPNVAPRSVLAARVARLVRGLLAK